MTKETTWCRLYQSLGDLVRFHAFDFGPTSCWDEVLEWPGDGVQIER